MKVVFQCNGRNGWDTEEIETPEQLMAYLWHAGTREITVCTDVSGEMKAEFVMKVIG